HVHHPRLIVVFDALRDHGCADGVSERGHCPYRCPGPGLAGAGGQSLGNLDELGRGGRQDLERGVTIADIIDREAETDVAVAAAKGPSTLVLGPSSMGRARASYPVTRLSPMRTMG